MTVKKGSEALPLPVEKLEELAAYYDAEDTAAGMRAGQWVDPRPMKTTSLRLPVEVVDALKVLAQTRDVRYTALVREIIEQALSGGRLAESGELTQINERLARIEAAVVERPARRARPKNAGRKSAKRSKPLHEDDTEHGRRASA